MTERFLIAKDVSCCFSLLIFPDDWQREVTDESKVLSQSEFSLVFNDKSYIWHWRMLGSLPRVLINIQITFILIFCESLMVKTQHKFVNWCCCRCCLGCRRWRRRRRTAEGGLKMAPPCNTRLCTVIPRYFRIKTVFPWNLEFEFP